MALTPLHVQDVCNGAASQQNYWSYQPGTICKYLHGEMVGKKYVHLCLKHAPAILDKLKKAGRLPYDFDKHGDNCPGYRYMKYVDQGYNIKS